MVKGQYVMKKRKLVIINDNERFCMELESRFVKYGYIVMAKLKTADEALSFFEKGNKPDVAIVDMLMPKYDGSQLLHRIKTMGKGKRHRVYRHISPLYGRSYTHGSVRWLCIYDSAAVCTAADSAAGGRTDGRGAEQRA